MLGFFVVNFPHGKIFLGDGGAYFCGFLLAALGVLLPARNPEVSAWTAILICAYPVIETLASMRRKASATGTASASPTGCISTCSRTAATPAAWSSERPGTHLRNPATSRRHLDRCRSLTTGFVAIAYDSAVLSAALLLPHGLHLRRSSTA